MTNNIAKIRAALELREPYDPRENDRRLDALAALAELEKAAAEPAAEPVAWMWNDEIGVPHASAGSKKPVWLESSASAEYIKQANLRPLYAAPPAPVAEIRETLVTDAMTRRVANSFCGDDNKRARFEMLEVLGYWRRELGPTLGLVEIREPTPEECDRIITAWWKFRGDKSFDGRAMFDAVRAVMGGGK